MSLLIIDNGIVVSSLQTPDNLLRKNTSNVLAGITPAFTNWSVQPGTLAEMVEETFDKALSTPGTSLAGAKITYDLGVAKRIIVVTDNQFADMITWASLDGITWRDCTLNNVAAFFGVYRYLEIRCGAHATVTYIKLIAYNI